MFWLVLGGRQAHKKENRRRKYGTLLEKRVFIYIERNMAG